MTEETLSRLAGSEHGSAKTFAELEEIGGAIGRPVRERTTTYGAPTRATTVFAAALPDAG